MGRVKQERATKKQQELLQFVADFIKQHDYGPSYREIMRSLDYKSVSTVAVHIDALIAKGYLRRQDKSARSLEVVTTHSSSLDHAPGKDILYEKALKWAKQPTDAHTKDVEILIKALEIIGEKEKAATIKKELDAVSDSANS